MTNDKKKSLREKSRRRAVSRKASATTLSVLLAALALGVSASTSNAFLFAALQDPAPAPEAAPAPTPAPAPEAAAPAEPAPPTDAEMIAALKKLGINSKDQIPNPTENPAAALKFIGDVKNALDNPDPPAPEPSVPVKLADFDPAKSYSRLLYPSVAQRVGLSEAQNKQIGELMTKRSQALAAAAKEEWNKIIADSEAELKAVLTQEQVERFERGVVEKTIVLRFSKEKWEDVLRWFASEVGLQIIMSAPPQGTFTYSDKTPYSPKEALDVINGYLNFRGYTLFRYNEMLILHDFKTGSLPLQYLPKITPEDLPNQSRFDYVALTIPLERRSMNAVRQTIQPFMGPHCVLRSQGGNSLLVVDSVNALREIYAAAMSVHNPDAPPEGPYGPRGPRGPNGDRPDRAPEVPEWRAFALDGVSYTTVKEQVEVFAPGAKSLYNPQSNTLHYLAVPSQLNVVDGLLTRLKEGADPAKNAIAKAYSLEKVLAATPDAAWATARRLARPGQPLQAVLGGPTVQALCAQILETIQQVAPDAQLNPSGDSRQVFAIASAADHEKIAAALESMTAPPAPEEAPVVKVYRFPGVRTAGQISNSIFTAQRTVAPLAQAVPTSEGGLLVVATTAEHEKLAQTFKEFEASADAPETRQELKTYSMTARQVRRFMQIYGQLASTLDLRGAVRVSDPASPNRIVFWATATQHAQIAKIVDEVTAVDTYLDERVVPAPQGLPKAQDPAAPAPAAETPAPAEPAPAAETPAPAAETPAPAPAEPVPVAETPAPAPAEPAPVAETPAPAPAQPTPAEIAAQADAEKAAAQKAAENRVQLGDSGAYMTVLPVKKMAVSTAHSLLINSVPGIDATIDYTSLSIIVYGSKSAVEASAELLNRLETQLDVVLEVVNLTKDLPTEAVSAFPRIEPRVTATVDRANRRVFLYGKAPDVERLKKYIAQIENSTTDEEDGVYYFDVERDVPSALQDYVRRAVPGVEMSYDGTNRRFTLIGTPTEQLAAAKLITDAIQSLPAEDETRFYTLESRVPDKMVDLLKERVKNVQTIERDADKPNVLRVVAKPFQHAKIAEAIKTVQAEYPLDDANTFVAYPTTKELRDRFSQVQDDFTKKNGSIKILRDDSENVFAVWALPAQHEALKKLLDELSTIESGAKETAAIYTPQRVDAATLVSILTSLQPDLTVTRDVANKRLILRGEPSEIEEAKATLKTLDVADDAGIVRTYKSFDVKGFYSYDGVGNYYSPSYYVRDLAALVPAARVTYDYYNQAIVVWGTEEEQAIVEKAVSNLAGKNELNNKILRWPVRRANYSTLVSSIYDVVGGATPRYDARTKTLVVRVKNAAALAEVQELLELLDPENPGDGEPTLQYYEVGGDPTEELVDALSELVPNAARISIDEKNRQLCVIATPAEQKVVAENVERLAKSFGSADGRLIPYPVLGTNLDVLVESMTEAYPNATFEADERAGRVLVRATLDEHVKISEEIERLNAADADPNDPNAANVGVGPRVVVYDVESVAVATQIRGVVANLFPGASVFGGTPYGGYGRQTSGQKVAVLANGREQKMIAAVVEQLNAPAETDKLVFVVYPFGNVDSNAIDALVGNMIPSALAVPTAADFGQMGRGSAQQRMMARQQRQQRFGYGQTPTSGVPFYRVDSQSQTVAIFAPEKDCETVREAIEKLAALEGEEAKSTSRVYRLGAALAYQLYPTVMQIAPSVVATPTSGYEIVVYGPEAELVKVDEFFAGIADEDYFNKGASQMRLFLIPEESRYQRDVVVAVMNGNFAPLGANAYPGALSNQIAMWGPKAAVDRAEKFFNEIVATPNEAVYETYPLKHVTLPVAMQFLTKVCPNVDMTPDYQRGAIVVLGSPLQQATVKNALENLDAPFDPEIAPIVCVYNWTNALSYWATYYEIRAHFPTVGIASDGANGFVVSAPEEAQQKVSAFLEARQLDDAKRARSLKTYYLTRVNFNKVVQVVPTVLPTVAVYPGKGANEIFVVATQLEQVRFAELLSQLETVEEGANANGIAPKIYRVSAQGASVAIGMLAPQLPGVVMYPLTGNRIAVWGSVSDHEYVANALETIGEAFPEAALKKYPLNHIRYADVIGYVTTRFAGEGAFFPSSDGSLMVQASENVQAEVAKLLAELDVEESAETRPIPVAYDISDVPVASHAYASAAITRIAPEAVQFPTTTPGYLVISARPSVHEKIAEIVEELLKERPGAKQKMVAYTVRRMTLAQLAQLIVPLYPNVKIGAGANANQIVVLAKPDEHEKISALIDQLNAETDDGTSSRVYRLKNSQLAVARTAILTMFPQAVVVIDQGSRSLLIKAYADQLEQIDELVTEIDEKDPERNTSFRVFNIGTISFSRLLAPLRNFYANDPAFQVQLDSANQCLIVRGTAIQHKAVEELIAEVRAGGLADPEAYMQTYTLKNQSSLTSLYSIFYEQGRDINMYRDYSTGKLVVIGRPEEHKMVRDILDVVAPEETELAVFDLVYVDPSTARQVFGMIETDGTYVDVRFDANSNQLFIRATATKLEEIRRVLIKMGEKGLEKMKPFADTTEGGGSSTDGKRIYIRDGATAKETGSVDLKNLEPVTAPQETAETPKAEAPAQPTATISGDSTGPIRTITVEGADAAKILDKALENWDRDNKVTVVPSDGGVVQEKTVPTAEPPAPAQTAPAVETPAPAQTAPAVETPAPAQTAPAVETPAPAQTAPAAETPAPAQTAPAVEPPAPAQTAPAVETPAPAQTAPAVETPAPAQPAPAVENPAPTQTAPAAEPAKDEAPKVASALAPLFFSLSRSSLIAAATGALVLDGETSAQPIDLVAESAAKSTDAAQEESVQSAPTATQAPGVYVSVNPDGTLTLLSNDEAALEELQRRLADAVDATNVSDAETASESTEKTDETAVDDDPSNPDSRNYLSYMTPENLAEARERVLMESRNYTVYTVKNVGVNQLLPRLQTYLAERTQRRGGYGYGGFGYDYYGYGGGIQMQTISPQTQLTFQPDVSLNTITVYGSKADRDAAGAMIVLLDQTDLFPQPITKPYKIKVENTSPTRMAQQVLNAFSRKFQTTLMPGNLSPRISPNPATGCIEVYAPESLAQEIEEYVKEVDKEILEESVRKVRVVELKSLNSAVLSQYMTNLRARQTASQMLSTPYIGGTTPFIPQQNYGGGYRGGYGGFPGGGYGMPGMNARGGRGF